MTATRTRLNSLVQHVLAWVASWFSKPSQYTEEVEMTAPVSNEPASVQLARDVLSHIQGHEARYMRGRYLLGDVPSTLIKGDLRDHLPVIEQKCTMCALGAMLVSKARLWDRTPMESLFTELDSDLHEEFEGLRMMSVGRRAIIVQLEEVFDSYQLNLIESAFEMKRCGTTPSPGDLGGIEAFHDYMDRVDDAINFGCQRNIGTPAERLGAIMNNIIENNGVFNPPDYSVTHRQQPSYV